MNYPPQYPPQPYYPQPAPKKGLGCLAWGGIIGVGGIVLLGVFCVALAKLGPTEEQRKKRDEANAAASASAAASAAIAADAAAQANLQFENAVRKGCKLAPTKEVFTVPDDALRERCQDMVREGLKVPGSGDFPSDREDSKTLTSDDSCNRTYTSWVDAKNAFGVKIRTRYACTFDPRTGLFSYKVLH
ncbi:MAG: hypothetical protein QOG85_850 [Gaiellaceae bacterium]|jgi:hypothetical protein|nr:hypothetical protein [Gaiellaceae bacterium]